MKNLVLVGFMGSGKSAIGRRAAERLGLSFVDMDAEIERSAGRKISEIFAQEGESFLPVLERREAIGLAGEQGRVKATGGGLGLWVDAETAFERTKRATHRPLLQSEDPKKRIEDLLAKRGPLYQQIDNVVDTRGRSMEAIVEDVVRIYRESEGKNQSAGE